MDTLRIRMYNVLFGDAILVTVPDRSADGKLETRNILFDVGNVLPASKGGADEVFEPIVKDILKVLNGKPLDMYVMTHEHMDHTQGLPYAEKNFYKKSEGQLRKLLKTKYSWLTASSAAHYYDTHPDAKKQKLYFAAVLAQIDRFMKSRIAIGEPIPSEIASLWSNNSPRETEKCVSYLRDLCENPDFVYRGFDAEKSHLFSEKETKIEIWAPEENTADYYGKYSARPLTIEENAPEGKGSQKTTSVTVTPPRGVDAGAFYDLVAMRTNPYENLLAIDQAANNTSVVLCLEWRGYRLLFTGDAEDRSWKMMDKAGVLKPVHFLKVSHHGSCTGTPETELLEKFFPAKSNDGKHRYAAVSTCFGSPYNSIPDDYTLNLIRSRCDGFYATNEGNLKPGKYVDITFEA